MYLGKVPISDIGKYGFKSVDEVKAANEAAMQSLKKQADVFYDQYEHEYREQANKQIMIGLNVAMLGFSLTLPTKSVVEPNNTANIQAGSKAGSLIIEEGGSFSASEIKAAEYMRDLGNDVTLRVPQGTRSGGGTSDLLVNGVNYDVYTPITGNPSRIISGIAAKKDQASGIVLDLAQTTVTAEDLGDIMARLAGKGVTTIKDIVILK